MNNKEKNEQNCQYSIKEVSNRLPSQFRNTFSKNVKKIIDRSIKEKKVIRVYSDGCFDLFHYGHARQLEQIKKMIPNVYLVVGVCGDKDIKMNKGNGIMNDEERVESIKHCKWSDEIIFPAPWVPTIKFMDDNNLDLIAHDIIPYSNDENDDCYLEMKKNGRFLPTLRTEGISTSDVLVRILKDREDYYKRNLKKGINRKDMNLNYVEYLYIQMKSLAGNLNTCLKKFDNKNMLDVDEEEIFDIKKQRKRSYNKKK